MKNTKIEAIVFDLAGTLIDFGSQAPSKVLIHIFNENGIPITKKEAIEHITNTLHTYDFFVETLTSKRGKVGRCLGNILVQKTDKRENIAQELIEKGLAEKFNTSE